MFHKQVVVSQEFDLKKNDLFSLSDIISIDDKIIKNIVFSMKNMNGQDQYFQIKKTKLNRQDKDSKML
jgi:hypothetical protein